ncbi:MAG TPA: helix-turn-helix domain-containing protein [Rubrobacteraceae bacterium]|nr:helix-turn-helix domain-containing protein [Rubrobacteraceae bacterium]
MTVEEAARILGIKEESVRKRVRRGKMRSGKDADGRLYVYLDSTEAVRDENGDSARGLYADQSRDEPADPAREVMEAKDEAIRILQRQLEEEREARRRADTIIVQLTQLNSALATGDVTAELPDAEEKAVVESQGVRSSSERSSWWRRRLGGG